MKGFYFGDERSNSEAEIERTEGIALLHSAGRRDCERVIIKKKRGRAIAPISPHRKSGEDVTSRSHESLSIDRVKGVREVNFQKGKRRIR